MGGVTQITFIFLAVVASLGSAYNYYQYQHPPSYGFNSGHSVRPPPPFPIPQQYFENTNTFQQNPFLTNNQGSSAQSPEQQDTNPNRCGIVVIPGGCANIQYRSFDGTCNNLKNPSWGTPNSTYSRLLPPIYGDGVYSPTDMGRSLPLPRIVSVYLHPDVQLEDPKFTLAAMQYGQIITHDMSMIAGSTQSIKHKTQCCTDNGRRIDKSIANYHCYPIDIPVDDPVHSKTDIQCTNFVRTINDRDRNCAQGDKPAEQLTVVTSYLDLSIVYGSATEQNTPIRQFQGGRLITVEKWGKEFPPDAPNRTAACGADFQDQSQVCYLAGDMRVNQNPQLTIFQIILLREHNRVADALAKLNPHWSDETIFQEARRIVIAEHQHITYYEWLPLFIGLENSLKHGVLYNTKDYVNDYKEHISANVLNSHATAAFRYFHTAIAGRLQLLTPSRHSVGALRLSDWFNRPVVLEEGDNFDSLTRGMTTQPELKLDPYFDNEITQFLFRGNRSFGTDLRAFDIQRNRDHGLASYNDHRSFCGLPKAHTFEDFLDYIPAEYVQKLAKLYKHPDDVDLTVGGTLERHVHGTHVGPTFLCILTEQFYRTRVADRFFYENANKGSKFTLEQLNEIRKSSISKMLCDNGHHITEMQPRGFEIISAKNPLLPCSHLPEVNLALWKDNAPVNNDYEDYSGYQYYKK